MDLYAPLRDAAFVDVRVDVLPYACSVVAAPKGRARRASSWPSLLERLNSRSASDDLRGDDEKTSEDEYDAQPEVDALLFWPVRCATSMASEAATDGRNPPIGGAWAVQARV